MLVRIVRFSYTTSYHSSYGTSNDTTSGCSICLIVIPLLIMTYLNSVISGKNITMFRETFVIIAHGN